MEESRICGWLLLKNLNLILPSECLEPFEIFVLAYPTLGQPVPDFRDQQEGEHEEKPAAD